MASVFHKRYRSRNGKLSECTRWTVQFADWSDPTRSRGITRNLSGFEHKGASEELGHKLERLARLRAAREPMDAELSRYLDGLPVRIRVKLARWGLLHPAAEAALRPLLDSVAAYEQALRDGVASRKQKGRAATAAHVQKTGNRIRKLLALVNAKTFGDITLAAVGRCLRELQIKGARRKGIGSKSTAHYFGATFAFLAWSTRARLIPSNPLTDAARPDAAVNRRHERRALEVPEITWLLQATRHGAERFGVSGEDRYWLLSTPF